MDFRDKMLKKFICPLTQDHIEILDFNPPEADDSKLYPAMINDNQLVVLKMTGVDSNVLDSDTSLLKINKFKFNICEGVLETELLSLTEHQNSSDINTIVYIEKHGQQVVYR